MLSTSIEKLSSGRLLRIARLGSGPPVVLLHGYPDNLQIWSELAIRLADQFEVIAFDWPGMGYSEAWPGGTTPFHMAERLHKILDELAIERASLVGMDMGGQPALVFAATHPERIHRLVVMNSLVLWDENTSWEIQVLRKYGWNRFILHKFPRIVFWRAERTFLPHRRRLPSELRADLWKSFSREDVRSFIARLCAGYQGTLMQLPEEYKKITCPTLVCWGEQDQHFPLNHAKRLCAAVPGSSLKIIPKAKHWMAWYLADTVAQSIRTFLA
ncbi:MAG TPA: alpha/beta hydrolase [Pyrinomonadaceae bacterium]|jgi:pimeloyl-ACP methyl ester carboxylesterase|nr:alpha/beta hydrolase [Pyrinomonadaceae bacterium]